MVSEGGSISNSAATLSRYRPSIYPRWLFGKDVSVEDFFVGVFKGWETKRIDSTYLRALHSLLIFTPNQLMARSYSMQAMKPDNRYDARVREIVIDERNVGALIGLAKFRRTEDIDLILTTVIDGRHRIYGTLPYLANLQAVWEFPHLNS